MTRTTRSGVVPCAAAFALALFLTACASPRPPAGTIPGTLFVDVYARYLVLKEEGKLTGIDSAAVELKADTLYGRFHLKRPQMQAALAYYREDLPRWRALLEQVIHRLEQLQHEEPRARAAG